MKVTNLDRSSVLSSNCRLATSYWDRLRGLLFRPPLAEGEGLLIRPCNSVHTFMMGFPIDVLFIDRTGTVLRIWESMPPQRASRIVRKAHSTLELPAGVARRTGTQVGHVLSLDSD